MNRLPRIDARLRNLEDAAPEIILRQSAEYWDRLGGLPRIASKSPVTIARGLSQPAAFEWLSRLCDRIAQSGDMHVSLVLRTVNAWFKDLRDRAVGYPIEAWAVPSTVRPGRLNIVCNSLPLYRLPWAFGRGWYLTGAAF